MPLRSTSSNTPVKAVNSAPSGARAFWLRAVAVSTYTPSMSTRPPTCVADIVGMARPLKQQSRMTTRFRAWTSPLDTSRLRRSSYRNALKAGYSGWESGSARKSSSLVRPAMPWPEKYTIRVSSASRAASDTALLMSMGFAGW